MRVGDRNDLRDQLLPTAGPSPLLARIRAELGPPPLVIFDQFDDYQIAHRTRFLRDGRWIGADERRGGLEGLEAAYIEDAADAAARAAGVSGNQVLTLLLGLVDETDAKAPKPGRMGKASARQAGLEPQTSPQGPASRSCL